VLKQFITYSEALIPLGSIGNGVSANLEDTSNLPIKPEVKELVKKSGWISEEYEHLWRRDGGGSAALTSHGILSKSVRTLVAAIVSLQPREHKVLPNRYNDLYVATGSQRCDHHGR